MSPRPIRACLCLCLVAPVTAARAAEEAAAPPAPRAWYERFSVHGYADLYYGFNFNRPADGANFMAGTGSSGKRHNSLSLNLAALDVAYDLSPVQARLVLHYGTAIEVLYAGEPRGAAIGPEVYKYIQQATVGYRAPLGRGLLIEAGIYPSHLGYESFASKDNWSYTRPWMGELSPYYQAGIRLSYAFTDHLSAQLHLLNGWQLIGDNNDAKAVGSQLMWSSERLVVSLNTFFGPELPGDNTHWRLFCDLIVVIHAARWLSLAAAADVGYQQLPEDDGGARRALWYTAYGWARLEARPWLRFAVRAGYYDDRDGLMSGTTQAVAEATGTIELRPRDSYILKIEGRYDGSTAAVFGASDRQADGMPLRRRDQALLMLGAVAAF